MSTVHPMVLKAARAWCKRHAEACGLDDATLWAEREAGFITEAQAALEACGALELLEALHEARNALNAWRLDNEWPTQIPICQCAICVSLRARNRADAALGKAWGRL